MNSSAVAIIIFICVLISFIINKIPIALTALLGAFAMALCGIMPFSDIFMGFFNDTVFMVVGVMIIGNTMFETGCAQLLGRSIIRIKGVGSNEKIFLTVILVLTSVLSAFLSNTATVAMMIPLVSSIAQASEGKITKKNTLMAVGIASIVGGNATLAGSTPQLVAQGILGATPGCRILTFFELAKGTIPIVIVMILYFITIGYKLEQKVFDFPDVKDIYTDKNSDSTYSKYKVVISILIFLGCIICFTAGIASFGIIAMAGACLCCLTGCIKPSRVWKLMDWRTVLMLGGSLGIATGMGKSGALQQIASMILVKIGGATTYVVGAVILITCAIMGNVMSHTATASIMTPLAIELAHGLSINPLSFVVMVIIGCNLAFSTPMSTPPLTMTMVAGYRFTDYVKVGGVFNVLAVVIAIITIPLLY